MTIPSLQKITFVSCSVLQAELVSLQRRHWHEAKLRFLCSMLHMHPERLGIQLSDAVAEEMEQGQRILLVYGDCSALATNLEALPGVARTRGHNCCELLLGQDVYQRLGHAGAFFLIAEWVKRWREIFTIELGLNKEIARDLMQDMHRSLIYLDTGLAPVPVDELRECEEYCGLSCVVRPVTLDHLQLAIQEAIERLTAPGASE